MDNKIDEHEINALIDELIGAMRDTKPHDRSEKDRYWAIAITDAEKLRAVWQMYIVEDEGE